MSAGLLYSGTLNYTFIIYRSNALFLSLLLDNRTFVSTRIILRLNAVRVVFYSSVQNNNDVVSLSFSFFQNPSTNRALVPQATSQSESTTCCMLLLMSIFSLFLESLVIVRGFGLHQVFLHVAESRGSTSEVSSSTLSDAPSWNATAQSRRSFPEQSDGHHSHQADGHGPSHVSGSDK